MATIRSSDWQAEHLRVSLFSDTAWGEDAEQIFSAIFNQEPIESSKKPASGESSASGSVNDGRASVVKTINRFDVVIQPEIDGAVPLPMLNNIEFRLDQLRELVCKWIDVQPQGIVRVAVSGRILLAATDVADSYQKLKELVKVIQIDTERFREMQFQVNLSKKSAGYPELTINRLTQWGSITLGIGLIAGMNAVLQPTLNQSFCSCVLDMNTDPNITTPFPPNNAIALLNEVCGEAIAVLNEGIS